MMRFLLLPAALLLMATVHSQSKVVFQDTDGSDLADTVELFYVHNMDYMPFSCFITNTDTVNGYKIRLKRKVIQRVIKTKNPYAYDMLCIGLFCSEFKVADTIATHMTEGSEFINKNSRISTIQPWDIITYTPDTSGITIYEYVIVSETDQPDVFIGQDTVVVKYNSNGFVGIFDNSCHNSVFIESYPNPVTDKLKIRYQISDASKATVAVYNILGRKMVEAELEKPDGIQEIDAQNWDPGLYFISIESQGMTLTSKKVIKK